MVDAESQRPHGGDVRSSPLPAYSPATNAAPTEDVRRILREGRLHRPEQYARGWPAPAATTTAACSRRARSRSTAPSPGTAASPRSSRRPGRRGYRYRSGCRSRSPATVRGTCTAAFPPPAGSRGRGAATSGGQCPCHRRRSRRRRGERASERTTAAAAGQSQDAPSPALPTPLARASRSRSRAPSPGSARAPRLEVDVLRFQIAMEDPESMRFPNGGADWARTSIAESSGTRPFSSSSARSVLPPEELHHEIREPRLPSARRSRSRSR